MVVVVVVESLACTFFVLRQPFPPAAVCRLAGSALSEVSQRWGTAAIQPAKFERWASASTTRTSTVRLTMLTRPSALVRCTQCLCSRRERPEPPERGVSASVGGV